MTSFMGYARVVIFGLAAVCSGLAAAGAWAGSKPAGNLPASSYPLPPPDASPSSIFKPDVGKPFTQTGPRIEYQPPRGSEGQTTPCGPGEVRGMSGRCIR